MSTGIEVVDVKRLDVEVNCVTLHFMGFSSNVKT